VAAKIAFLLGGAARNIRGGFKVLFIYANFLAQQGFAVTIFFPATNSTNRRGDKAARALRYVAGKLNSSLYLPESWFHLHPSIETRWIWRCGPELSAQFDVSIIAGHEAGGDVLEEGAGGPRARGKLLYLFQEYEYYMIGGETVRSQIEALIRQVDMVVAISPAAREVAAAVRGPRGVHLVSNGVEFEKYFVSGRRSFGDRKTLGFAFREEDFKRSGDVVAALSRLRSKGLLQGVTCWAYGTRRRPGLPDWIRYHYRASDSKLRELLNSTAVFVVASLFEGWGLPGAEAMACGAALVTTRNGGCEAYAIHMENALLCAPGNVEELAEAIRRLLQDLELAERIATRGHDSIQTFTWETAAAGFLRCMTETLNRA
jgi:glycosyltransferase involved in cell wall biosynthesis